MPSPRHRKPSRHPLYPEPGGWLLDDLPGMPPVEQPEPLPRGRKLDSAEVRDYVAYEGLGFCVYEYISSGRITDKRLAVLWEESRVALRKVVDYLETVRGESRIHKVKQRPVPAQVDRGEEKLEIGEDTNEEISI